MCHFIYSFAITPLRILPPFLKKKKKLYILKNNMLIVYCLSVSVQPQAKLMFLFIVPFADHTSFVGATSLNQNKKPSVKK